MRAYVLIWVMFNSFAFDGRFDSGKSNFQFPNFNFVVNSWVILCRIGTQIIHATLGAKN